MRISFYGVRGSTPVPQQNMMKYGGNTACVYVKLSDGTHLVFDAGTGIRQLGFDLASSNEPIHILMSHSHWDHVIGYPFFQPIYEKDRDIFIYPSRPSGHDQLCSLLGQMDGAHFPISAQQLPSKTRCFIRDVQAELNKNCFNIKRKQLHHPGGGFAYRVDDHGVSCAYITDNELPKADLTDTAYKGWVDFCRDIDVLIHDAQYLESEMPSKRGWGHSTITSARQLAIDANVKTLVLFHHDPDRTDSEVDAILGQTRAFFDKQNSNIKGLCAHEGLVVEASRKDVHLKMNDELKQVELKPDLESDSN